jgi:hypothetical protein
LGLTFSIAYGKANIGAKVLIKVGSTNKCGNFSIKNRIGFKVTASSSMVF